MLTFSYKIPETKKAIPTKLVLQCKLNLLGQILMYKAYLVAQGFRQVEAWDCKDSIVPVVSLLSVHVVLFIAAAKGFAVREMEVVTALLGRKLHEEVYGLLPVGVFGGERLACLNRDLYRLKQSSRRWFTMIDNLLITKMGFHSARCDCSVYTHDKGTMRALYVDDMLIAGALRELKLVCDK